MLGAGPAAVERFSQTSFELTIAEGLFSSPSRGRMMVQGPPRLSASLPALEAGNGAREAGLIFYTDIEKFTIGGPPCLKLN